MLLLADPPETTESLKGAAIELTETLDVERIEWLRQQGVLDLAVDNCVLDSEETIGGIVDVAVIFEYVLEGATSFRDAGLSQTDGIVFTAATLGSPGVCDPSVTLEWPDPNRSNGFIDVAELDRLLTEWPPPPVLTN